MPNGDLPNNDNVWQTTEPLETEKQRYQQVISITGSLLSVNVFVFSCQTSNCRLLLASHIYRPRVSNARAALRAHVRTLAPLILATRGLRVKLHLVTCYLRSRGARITLACTELADMEAETALQSMTENFIKLKL